MCRPRGATLDDPGAEPGIRWLVSGRVQGVGFRWFVLQAARRSGVAGDVRNLRDGRVEVRARGRVEQLERLLQEVRTGPPGSHVADVAVETLEDEVSFDGFTVRH